MGRGAAAACLSRGAKVVIVGRDQEKLAAVAGRLGAGVTPLSCDANDEAAVESTFNSLQADGGFHHVLCTVGPSVAGGAISGVSLAAAKQQFDLKSARGAAQPPLPGAREADDGSHVPHTARRYMSAFLVAKHASTRIADGGSIAFISGSLSRRPSPGSAVLASANAALDALAKALAVELAPRVRVNTVSPGLCDTEIWDKVGRARTGNCPHLHDSASLPAASRGPPPTPPTAARRRGGGGADAGGQARGDVQGLRGGQHDEAHGCDGDTAAAHFVRGTVPRREDLALRAAGANGTRPLPPFAARRHRRGRGRGVRVPLHRRLGDGHSARG